MLPISYAARMPAGASQSSEDRKPAPILVLIGLGKLVKAAALIAVGIGALELSNHDTMEAITRWVHALRADPDDRFIHSILERLSVVTPAQLERFSIGTFAYAALFLAEEIGLWLLEHWAEYLTVVSTSVLLPLEVYELTRRFTLVRVAILVLNIAIVAYLIVRVRSRLERTRHAH